MRLYKLGADAEVAVARNNLGLLYERGLGVAQSDTEAARLLKLSADQGDVAAETNLGGLYEAGRGGLAQSDVEAARLYRLAAEHGYDARNTIWAASLRADKACRKQLRMP